MIAGYAAIVPLSGTVVGVLPWQYLGVFALGALAAYVCYGAGAVGHACSP